MPQTRLKYRVRTGLSYPPGRRAEPGDVVDDLPTRSIPWLLSQGHIEPVEDAPAGETTDERG